MRTALHPPMQKGAMSPTHDARKRLLVTLRYQTGW
jgi:hypothetical protein